MLLVAAALAVGLAVGRWRRTARPGGRWARLRIVGLAIAPAFLGLLVAGGVLLVAANAGVENHVTSHATSQERVWDAVEGISITVAATYAAYEFVYRRRVDEFEHRRRSRKVRSPRATRCERSRTSWPTP